VARLSDVLRRPADGVGTLQVSYAGRLIEERVGGRRPGYVGSGCQDMRPVREKTIARGAGAEWLLGKVLELSAVGRKVQGAKERTWAWHLHRQK
jgi:hypothetical protein